MSASPSAVDAVVAMIVADDRRPLLVAIDGHSAAGKSTLAAAVAERVGAAIVHLDDFYADEPDEVRRRHGPAEGVDRYFDWRRLRAEALQPLAAGRSATYRPFDWAAGAGLGSPISVGAAPVVLVEGVYAGRSELADLIHRSVLVEADDAVRRRRRRDRHDPSSWELRWDAAERAYFERPRAGRDWDLVVPGTAEGR